MLLPLDTARASRTFERNHLEYQRESSAVVPQALLFCAIVGLYCGSCCSTLSLTQKNAMTSPCFFRPFAETETAPEHASSQRHQRRQRCCARFRLSLRSLMFLRSRATRRLMDNDADVVVTVTQFWDMMMIDSLKGHDDDEDDDDETARARHYFLLSAVAATTTTRRNCLPATAAHVQHDDLVVLTKPNDVHHCQSSFFLPSVLSFIAYSISHCFDCVGIDQKPC
jgi:hypothetical protein